MIILYWTLVSWIALLGSILALLWCVLVPGQVEILFDTCGSRSMATGITGCVVLCFAFMAINGTFRSVLLLRARLNPEILESAVKALTSDSLGKQRRALQLLADHYGHPFGSVLTWPLVFPPRDSMQAMVAVYYTLHVGAGGNTDVFQNTFAAKLSKQVCGRENLPGESEMGERRRSN